MTVHLPVVIDPHGMGPIIAAVRNAYVRKPVPINPKLDPGALSRDIRRAMVRHNILRNMGRAGWDKRRQHGRRLLKARTADAIVELLADGKPGSWWLRNLAATIAPDEYLAWDGPAGLSRPQAIAARLGVTELHVRVRRLAERFVRESDVQALLGPGSALEWLIRRRPADLPEDESCCLVTIFERHFGLKARINISHKRTGAGPRRYYTRSSYLEFVRAVLAAEGIEATPGTIRTIFNRRK